MALPLLRTKLYLSPDRPGLMPRPRLVARMNAGLAHKFTLVSAPAGFGKTTFLGEWSRKCGRPVAWLSLDPADNDPTRFWTYLITALQAIRPHLGAEALAALQSRQPPPVESLLTNLVNELAEGPAPLVLVLDDLHLVTTLAVHDGLVFFVDNLLPHVHLVVATRADPPWPLARYRGRAEMAELRTADLRFTPEEAAAFLNDAMGLGLPAEEITALEARTEGWIAGLQLAALSMQGREDVAAFVRAFSGSHRFILDYLVEEVLERQAPAVQDFLLRTSVLDRLSGPLCDAVLGESEEARERGGEEARERGGEEAREREEGSPPRRFATSQSMLEYLERANLFVVPLDDRREWYRYHHLFADLLHSRLEALCPGEIPRLYHRASAWYAAGGQIAEAVSYALLAGDVQGAARLLEKHAIDMIYHGQLATLVGWLEALPAEVVQSWPWLDIAYAWARAYSGQWEGVEALLHDAEQAAQRLLVPPSEAGAQQEADHIAGHVRTIQAYCHLFGRDYAQGEVLAQEALRLLPAEDVSTRGFAAMILASMAGLRDDIAVAIETLSAAVEASRVSGDLLLTITVLSEIAAFYIVQGRLNQAAAACEEALQLAGEYARRHGQPPPIVAFVYARQSALEREWNDLDAAIRDARRAAELCLCWGQRDGLLIAYQHLMAALYAGGDLAEAFQTLAEVKRIGRGFSVVYEAGALAWEARLYLAQGNLAAALQWAQNTGLDPDGDPTVVSAADYRLLARVLAAQRRTAEALRVLARLQRLHQDCGAEAGLIKDLVLEAVVRQVRGEPSHALVVLERALVLAEPEGYVRMFLDEGPPMVELLRAAAGRGIAVNYVRRLLAALGKVEAEERAATEQPQPLVEPLSSREIEVLGLLAAGYANKEIADALVISVGTVKNHLKSIYGKLEVDSRTRAVARARELGLIHVQGSRPVTGEENEEVARPPAFRGEPRSG